jgi:hypothetical protein
MFEQIIGTKNGKMFRLKLSTFVHYILENNIKFVGRYM